LVNISTAFLTFSRACVPMRALLPVMRLPCYCPILCVLCPYCLCQRCRNAIRTKPVSPLPLLIGTSPLLPSPPSRRSHRVTFPPFPSPMALWADVFHLGALLPVRQSIIRPLPASPVEHQILNPRPSSNHLYNKDATGRN